jgi:hypothetical protein
VRLRRQHAAGTSPLSVAVMSPAAPAPCGLRYSGPSAGFSVLPVSRCLPQERQKMTVFCDVAPCCPVNVYHRFRSAYCLHRQGDEYHNTTYSSP